MNTYISPSVVSVSSTQESPKKHTPKRKRRSYRDEQAFLFTLRLRSRLKEARVVVRVFEAESPNPEISRITPVVMIEGSTIFPRGFLFVQSEEGGWTSEEQAKMAVMQLLSLRAGDAETPEGFHTGFSAMQRAFFDDHADGIKRLIKERFHN